MEKTVKILSLKDQGTDYQYWLSQPVIARLAAIEVLRQQYIKFQGDAEPRLQRVCNIIKRTRS
jgi:hypothetical protein